MQQTARVYSISAASPFLATLIDSLVDGRLIPGFDASNPAELGRALIYVPTRRTADALKDAFLPQMQKRGLQSVILPKIHVIGDTDEDLLPLKVAAGDSDGFWDLPVAMDAVQRRLSMSALVHGWAQQYARTVLNLDPNQPLHVSATPTDAAYLAIDLLALIDAVHRERSDWSLLDTLVPEDYGTYWQMSLAFLKIATEFWPNHLAELGQKAGLTLVDPVERRNAVIAAEIKAIEAHDGPVIAAGSTGSIPATADLLEAVARHPKGALILPGLDYHLDEPSWQAIGTLHPAFGEAEPAAGHPQFNLKQLLDRMALKRDDVADLSGISGAPLVRETLMSEALRPAETTELWSTTLAPIDEAARAEALAGVSFAEAGNEQEEARIAALALREVLERPEGRAALVTPDRALARRVLLELKRWQIDVEDTAGMPLGETPPALLMRLMVECIVGGYDPVHLLALLKHPLASLGLPRAEVRRAARFLELRLLRGPRLGNGLQPMLDEFARRKIKAIEKAEKSSTGLPEIWHLAETLLARLGEATSPIEALMTGDEPAGFGDWIAALVAALEAIALDVEGTPDRLYDEAAGRSLRGFFDRTIQLDHGGMVLDAGDVAPFLVALMSGETVLSQGDGDPRLQLLGTLEARLLDVDRVVIGGLNEGSWPAETTSDAWLSRPMRAGMKLEPPERRIGLAAHDFVQAMGRKEVVLIRAVKSGGSPTVPSRWLQRLSAVAGETARKAMAERGETYVHWARQMDAPEPSEPYQRPVPVPPLNARPRSLSVTEIETWVRDPYALYAKHVLGLRELDDIGAQPGGAEKGSIIHDILGNFTKDWTGPYDESAVACLLKMGEEAFHQWDNFPELMAFWWPRFERIARWFVLEWEAPRNDRIAGRYPEITGRITLSMSGGDFVLRGRADRLDISDDDRLHVVDFKTGQPPTAKQVLPGFAPQLALEGYMAKLGGFDNIPKGIEVGDMAWIRLSGGRTAGEIKTGVEKDYAAEDIVELIGKRLLGLITAYDDPAKGYASRARPMMTRFAGSYDHLARVKEWSLNEGDE
ncbi:ATP-dependent helicase/nuclease subunit B [Cohaesibacter sp. ES.047]|uniref:double-strand break repair protein AddB n=1 Tax=Cohaesibacter sp. ES.047 TaxID=1798205 RepID=UPI000BB88C91|nr:double-strand break repair protein AddB [Cohaesibacter sp. ES.047]SNY91762.1 ATP-dependent helicase/nuclease subunit B [Cohaesibacter sp. ES.047]